MDQNKNTTAVESELLQMANVWHYVLDYNGTCPDELNCNICPFVDQICRVINAIHTTLQDLKIIEDQ